MWCWQLSTMAIPTVAFTSKQGFSSAPSGKNGESIIAIVTWKLPSSTYQWGGCCRVPINTGLKLGGKWYLLEQLFHNYSELQRLAQNAYVQDGFVSRQVLIHKYAPLKPYVQAKVKYFFQHTKLSDYKLSSHPCAFRIRHWQGHLSLQYHCKNLSVTVCFHVCFLWWRTGIVGGYLHGYFCKDLENTWETTF